MKFQKKKIIIIRFRFYFLSLLRRRVGIWHKDTSKRKNEAERERVWGREKKLNVFITCARREIELICCLNRGEKKSPNKCANMQKKGNSSFGLRFNLIFFNYNESANGTAAPSVVGSKHMTRSSGWSTCVCVCVPFAFSPLTVLLSPSPSHPVFGDSVPRYFNYKRLLHAVSYPLNVGFYVKIRYAILHTIAITPFYSISLLI